MSSPPTMVVIGILVSEEACRVPIDHGGSGHFSVQTFGCIQKNLYLCAQKDLNEVQGWH